MVGPRVRAGETFWRFPCPGLSRCDQVCWLPLGARVWYSHPGFCPGESGHIRATPGSSAVQWRGRRHWHPFAPKPLGKSWKDDLVSALHRAASCWERLCYFVKWE